MLSKPLAALSAGSSSSKSSSARQVVEREQVADRVAVLGPRQAPESRHLAGLRLRRGGGVELRLRGKPRRVRYCSCSGRGPSGGISSVRSLRTIFSQCSGVGRDPFDVWRAR